MKTNKNNRSRTTFASLSKDLTHWYGKNWWKSGLIALICLFVLPILANLIG